MQTTTTQPQLPEAEGPDDLLSIPEICKILGPVGKPLNHHTVRRMLKRHSIPLTRATGKSNGNITVRRRFITAHLDANTSPATLAVAA